MSRQQRSASPKDSSYHESRSLKSKLAGFVYEFKSIINDLPCALKEKRAGVDRVRRIASDLISWLVVVCSLWGRGEDMPRIIASRTNFHIRSRRFPDTCRHTIDEAAARSDANREASTSVCEDQASDQCSAVLPQGSLSPH